MAELGMQIAQQYLSPFDNLIGVIGQAGSGKSMIIKGMFPGLELTNDDEGVNIRPLPLLDVDEADTGFYNAHTYHLDIHFEGAFTQKHVLAEGILRAVELGKRVIVEHFDLIYSLLNRNADLLIGIGEEVIITRPTIFGPEPGDIAEVVFKSLAFRKMIHSAEDLCEFVMHKHGLTEAFQHSDVRRGFVFCFQNPPKLEVSLETIEAEVNALIQADLPISHQDERHIRIGEDLWQCNGPRMHVRSAGEIKHFTLQKEYIREPGTGKYLLVGLIGDAGSQKIKDLNKIG